MSNPKDKGPEGQQTLEALLSPSLLDDNDDNTETSIINNDEQEDQDQEVTTNYNTLNWLL
jgi:hypothetical protein